MWKAQYEVYVDRIQVEEVAAAGGIYVCVVLCCVLLTDGSAISQELYKWRMKR